MPGSEVTHGGERGSARIPVEMIGELKDEFGVTRRNVRDRVEVPPTARGIQYETAFTVLPGTYTIKLLARNDVTGRMGTFHGTFVVPDLERDDQRLRISSVVLTTHSVPERAAVYSVKQKVGQGVANPLVFEG